MAALTLLERLVKGYRPENMPNNAGDALVLFLLSGTPEIPSADILAAKLAGKTEVFRQQPIEISPDQLTLASQQVRVKLLNKR